MKTRTLLLLILLVSVHVVTAQEDRENSYILICNTNQANFAFEDYANCNTVSIRDSENKVASFLFVGMKKSKRIEVEVEGDVLNEEAMAVLKKLKAPSKVRIEKVVDETGTPLEGFRELVLRE